MGNTAKLIKILLGKNLSELGDDYKQKVLEVFRQMFSDSALTIPYNDIADFVYKNENSDEDNEVLNENIRLILDGSPNETKEILSKNLNKIKTNYSLSQVQREYILRNSKQAQETVSELHHFVKEFRPLITEVEEQIKTSKESMNKMNLDIADITTRITEVRDMKSGIYTDFIAILGVFSAFVFVMFGGIEISRAVFDVGDDLQTMDLSKIITVSSLMMIAILTLMYSLLLWIARITGKEFGNCMSCDKGCKHKWKHLFMRHSFYFCLLILLGISAFIASTFF